MLYYAGRGLGSWKQEDGGEPQRLFGPPKPGPEGVVIVPCQSPTARSAGIVQAVEMMSRYASIHA